MHRHLHQVTCGPVLPQLPQHKTEPLTDGFVHFKQMIFFRKALGICFDMSRQWNPHHDDIDLAVTMLQMHAIGPYGMTTNTIAEISAKVTMTSRFPVKLVWSALFLALKNISGSHLWFPNQLSMIQTRGVELPHLLQLKREYDKLVDQYSCVVQESYPVQDPPALPSDDNLLLPPLTSLQRWKTTLDYSHNTRMLEQLDFRTQQTVLSTEGPSSYLVDQTTVYHLAR
jgi:hypothetical protein